jgi:nitroreductase
MDLFEAVRKRYSHREAYTDALVPRADLERIVDAGIKAASGSNKQTTTFVIADDPALLAEIKKLHNYKAVRDAKAFIFCVIPKTANTAPGEFSFEVEDCATAAGNMLLAVTALDYATVWIDGQLRREGRAEKCDALLGVPADRTCRIMLPIGVPVKEGTQKEKLPFGKRASFNRHI